VNESRDLGYNDCQEMEDGFTKVCTLNEPAPARRQKSGCRNRIYDLLLLPLEEDKTEVKEMETLGVIEEVSPMANCSCANYCATCSSSDPYSSINNTNAAIVTIDAKNP
jgi:hypothetical protein